MSVCFILFGAQLSALLFQHPRSCESVSRWSHWNTFHDALMSAVFFRSKMLTRNLNNTCKICWLLDESSRLTLVSCHLALCAVTPFVGFRLPGGHGGVRTCVQFVYCVVLWSTLSAMHWPIMWLASWSSVVYTCDESSCWDVANELFSGAPVTANHNDVDTAVTNEVILYCVVTDHECVPCAATRAPLAFQGVVTFLKCII